jgi:hypothetical protein
VAGEGEKARSGPGKVAERLIRTLKTAFSL